ncbi:MAG: ribonuclease HI family protein [Acidobacteria bacterium]|nr:ribonuclease HI family protein [Acidobacteriota bacterium]
MSAVAWIDGGSRGNPGPAGCGIVIELSDGRRETHTLFLDTTTNNVAEYAALLALLERAAALGVTRLEARSDSELLVKQLNGEYRVKASHLQPLWLRASQLRRGFTRFAISHVRRADNAEADRLANLAIDERASTLPRPRGMR